jgi:hypothetical protein
MESGDLFRPLICGKIVVATSLICAKVLSLKSTKGSEFIFKERLFTMTSDRLAFISCTSRNIYSSLFKLLPPRQFLCDFNFESNSTLKSEGLVFDFVPSIDLITSATAGR